MRIRATLALLSLVVIAGITIFELVINESKPEAFERFKKKNDVEAVNGHGTMIDPELRHFEAYLTKFGKSYKNKESYNIHKREFMKTLQFIQQHSNNNFDVNSDNNTHGSSHDPVSFKLNLNQMSDWTQAEYESRLGLYWDDDWYGQDQTDDDSQSIVKESFSTLKLLFRANKDQEVMDDWPDGKELTPSQEILLEPLTPNKTVDWRYFTYE